HGRHRGLEWSHRGGVAAHRGRGPVAQGVGTRAGVGHRGGVGRRGRGAALWGRGRHAGGWSGDEPGPGDTTVGSGRRRRGPVGRQRQEPARPMGRGCGRGLRGGDVDAAGAGCSGRGGGAAGEVTRVLRRGRGERVGGRVPRRGRWLRGVGGGRGRREPPRGRRSLGSRRGPEVPAATGRPAAGILARQEGRRRGGAQVGGVEARARVGVEAGRRRVEDRAGVGAGMRRCRPPAARAGRWRGCGGGVRRGRGAARRRVGWIR
ncbi:hypothetical protein PVAP13_8KG311810, partial [Panicum virgatum]